MSARAVRKLYGKDSDLLAGIENSSEKQPLSEEQGGGEGEEEAPTEKKVNPFALLNSTGEDEEEEEDDDESGEEKEHLKSPAPPPATKSSKKKKNKKKKKTTKNNEDNISKEDENIDKMLEESMKKASLRSDRIPDYFKFLQVDTRNLDYERELRFLFGSEAVQDTVDGGQSIFPRLNSKPPKDWGGRDGRSVPGTSRKLVLTKIRPHFYPVIRREILMEELRNETDREPYTTPFKFVHSEQYRTCQNLFNFLLMTSADPQTILNHILPKSFYHVPTLMILAENLVQNGQHSEAADILERCLLVFDRALRSNFSFSTGTCRLPFKYSENREFYLVIFRYIKTLMRRGTWLTGFEFCKLLWSLSPEQDPYGAGSMIDFFAINSAEYQYLIDLGNDPHFQSIRWNRPNLFYSHALAYHHKNPTDTETTKSLLRKAVSKFPWVAGELLRGYFLHDYETSAEQTILSGLYVVQMATFWDNDKQIIKLLKEVCDDPTLKLDPITQGDDDDVSKDVVRYALQSEQKEVFSHIPKRFLEGEIWGDDLLPPDDDINPYPSRTSITRDDIINSVPDDDEA